MSKLTIEELKELLAGITPGDWVTDGLDICQKRPGNLHVIATSSHSIEGNIFANAEIMAAAPKLSRQLIEVMQENEELREKLKETTALVELYAEQEGNSESEEWLEKNQIIDPRTGKPYKF